MEKDVPHKRKPKESLTSYNYIITSDKIDFKAKTVITIKEGHYIMIKGSIQPEDITFENIYAPNIGAHKHIK